MTHDHPLGNSRRRLTLAVGLTFAVLLLELGGGIWSHSLALIADAGHVGADVLSLGLALFAVEQSRRPADARRTYGYHRAGILAALGNGLLLAAVVVVIVVEAVRRLSHPEPSQGLVMVATAGVAVVVNAILVRTLRGGAQTLNMRAALLHVVGDLGAGIGVMVAGAVILLTGWLYADPLVSLAIALLIAAGGVRILVETVNVLLEGTPRGIDLRAVEELVLASPGVISVHDLHVWSIASEQIALSCHLVVDVASVIAGESLVRDLEQAICDRFGISHTTIQLEAGQPCDPAPEHGFGQHNHPHPTRP